MRRAADLAIGTTSLYGQRPCQYDRISIPCEYVGGRAEDTVRYAFLGRTRDLGTFQFGDGTVKAFGELLRQSSNGLQVNSIFGERVNPRLRKIRDALGELELPADELLEHGTRRLVYGVQLAHNAREYLLGRAKRLSYLLPQRAGREAEPRGQCVPTRSMGTRAVTVKIARWWFERWLMGRISREDVLERVAGHVRDFTRSQAGAWERGVGARVAVLADDFEQGRLFGIGD